jgi:hypothetical protein
MGNMIIIALILDEQRKQKQKIKDMEEIKDFGAPLLEPLLPQKKLQKG